MDRRHFLQSATLVAGAVGASGALAAETNAPAGAAAAAPAASQAAPESRRWAEQRWLIDNIIKANTVDWDQPRTFYWAAPCGPDANADFALIRQRVQKFDDIAPAFEATARRREAWAREAEQANDPITARDNYFMATIHYGAAQWPLDENNEQNLSYNQKKRDCYTKYASLADHHVEAVWLPFQGKRLPAWFHLPPGYQGGRIPAVLSLPGMDGFKEQGVALDGDDWLKRGFAVLLLDGPGHFESTVLDIRMSMPAWTEVGKVVADWLTARPEVDPQKLGITGVSFGSFVGTIVAGTEPRFRAVAVAATAHEPGWKTVFDKASPTFKQRFMYMAGYTDEVAFDQFAKTLTWEGYADKITAPYLCIGGEADELSPHRNTEHLMAALKGPKRLVVYQDARHALNGSMSTLIGPSPWSMPAAWMSKVFAGQSFPSERWYVDNTGRITKTTL